MPKFTFRNKGVAYHFSVGNHDVPARAGEQLKPEEIDALVLEEGIQRTPQAKQTVKAMIAANKPVFLVESLALRDELPSHQRRRDENRGYLQIAAGGITTLASLSKLEESRPKPVQPEPNPGSPIRKGSGEKEPRPPPITRRRFLAGVGAAVGTALTASGVRQFNRGLIAENKAMAETRANAKVNAAAERIIHKDTLTPQELETMPADESPTMLISRRNAVIAKGLVTLPENFPYRDIGVIAGTAHYNLWHYIQDEELREKASDGYSPNIRRYPR